MKYINLFESSTQLWKKCEWETTSTWSKIFVDKSEFNTMPFTKKEIDSLKKFNRPYKVCLNSTTDKTYINLYGSEDENLDISILKNNDDYYYVDDSDENKYVCDTIEGLWQLLEEIYDDNMIKKYTEEDIILSETKFKINKYVDGCNDINKLNRVLTILNN